MTMLTLRGTHPAPPAPRTTAVVKESPTVKPLAKIVSTVVSLLAGLVGSKIVASLWTQVTGDDAPTKKNKDAQAAQSVTRVVAFAAISAAVAALGNEAAQRAGQKLAKRATSHPEEV